MSTDSPVPKKTATKKRAVKAAKKPSVKKVVKSAASKKTKKSDTKKAKATKTAVKKPAAKKTATIKSTSTAAPLIIKASAASLERPKVTEKKSLGLRNMLSVSVLSPYRFPMPIDSLAAQSARVAGLAFVLAGAVLTYTSSQSFFADQTSQQAAVIESAAKVTQLSAQEIEAIKLQAPMDVFTQPTSPKKIKYDQSVSQETDPVQLQVLESADTPVKQLSVMLSDADRVEFYAEPTLSAIPYFLNSGSKQGSGQWVATWDTMNTPVGDYRVFAVIESGDSRLRSAYHTVSVSQHETATSISQQQKSEMQKDFAAAQYAIDDIDITARIAQRTAVATGNDSDQLIHYVTENQEVSDEAKKILSSNKNTVDLQLDLMRSAFRSGKDAYIETVRSAISTLSMKLAKEQTSAAKYSVVLLSQEIERQITFLIGDIEKNESALKERTGTTLSTDTDNDGVTDFDEVTIYNTNPFVVDTDGDGFVDSAEVYGGFNPNDASANTVALYESPKETNVLPDNVLQVENVTMVDQGSTLLLTGRALPNSFVTIHIFSQPTVLTTSVNAKGAWQHEVTKEFVDGEHEVYLTMTDNTGKITTVSEPFAFTKSGDSIAVTGTSRASAPTPVPVPVMSIFTNQIMLLISSVAIVIIGLVLILVGFHLHSGRRNIYQPSSVV